MSIVTFWNSGKEQTGKTLSIAAIATYMAIEHNYRILIVSTGEGDTTLDRCFWEERKVKRNLGLFGPNTNIGMEEGISGLIKIMKSNKLEPENITNYTKIVFKDRLEILQTYKGNQESYKEFSKMYVDIINLANNYYDLVLVDLDTQIDETTTTQILDNSNLIVVNLSQRLASINKFIKLKEQVLNVDTIVKVDQPRATQGVEWYVRLLLNPTTTQETFVNNFYGSQEEAVQAYDKIVKQLCE